MDRERVPVCSEKIGPLSLFRPSQFRRLVPFPRPSGKPDGSLILQANHSRTALAVSSHSSS